MSANHKPGDLHDSPTTRSAKAARAAGLRNKAAPDTRSYSPKYQQAATAIDAALRRKKAK